jgi:hypothetical protein
MEGEGGRDDERGMGCRQGPRLIVCLINNRCFDKLDIISVCGTT